MLVLTMAPNQHIHIGNDIVVKIVEIRGNKARLGIVAPRAKPIHRDTVYEKIKTAEKNPAAAQVRT